LGIGPGQGEMGTRGKICREEVARRKERLQIKFRAHRYPDK